MTLVWVCPVCQAKGTVWADIEHGDWNMDELRDSLKKLVKKAEEQHPEHGISGRLITNAGPRG